MAENQSFKQITAEDLSREIDDNIKSETHDSKFNFNENSNFNSQFLIQTNLGQEKAKEGIKFIISDVVSSNNSVLSSTPFKNQYNFHCHPDKSNDMFHGAFNNFHNIIDHKNYLINHSKNYITIPENNKQFVLTQNTYGKSISISSNYNNKNKNIFQTYNKLIKNKNFKIHKDEKESNNFISRKSDIIDKNHPANKKIKQSEVLFEHLISNYSLIEAASEKIFLNGLVSMDELNNLPVKERTDYDSENELRLAKDDEKIPKTYLKNSISLIYKEIRKCENKNCDSKGTKKNIKQNWVKIKISKGKSKWLCNICSKAFKNKQYCYYCISIYKDNNNNFDGKDWICCDFCDSWHHINCEKIYFNKNIDKYLKQNPDYKYICPWCRNKEKTIKEKFKNKKIKKKIEEDPNEDSNKGVMLGKKLRNNYSNDNFEFLDFKPRILRKKVLEIKPVYNHISSLNINDNRDIYHDFYKIMNDNSNEELKTK